MSAAAEATGRKPRKKKPKTHQALVAGSVAPQVAKTPGFFDVIVALLQALVLAQVALRVAVASGRCYFNRVFVFVKLEACHGVFR